jgi:hypothetical protein
MRLRLAGAPRIVVLGAALSAASLAGAAATVDAPVERYRDSVALHQIGTVQGRAFQERRRPSLPDTPLSAVAISLLPRSEAWLFRLNAIKRGARDSLDAYRSAAPSVRQAREAYEKALLEVGAGDLPQGAVSDGEGRFTLEGVPAGAWVLLASRATYVSRTPRERPVAPGQYRPPTPPLPFLTPEKLAGYHVVTYWLKELTVVGGTVEPVELTDRNAWFTGVTENIQPPRLPDQPYVPRR